MNIVLPPDPFWPIRVVVSDDGGPVPFHLLLLWRWQFEVYHGAELPT